MLNTQIYLACKRKAYLLWEFDRAFLPETYGVNNEGQYPILYVYPIDESGINLGLIRNNLVVEGGSDSDITPPEIVSVTVFLRIQIIRKEILPNSFKNEAPSGALTSIKDIWFTIYGGPLSLMEK